MLQVFLTRSFTLSIYGSDNFMLEKKKQTKVAQNSLLR